METSNLVNYFKEIIFIAHNPNNIKSIYEEILEIEHDFFIIKCEIDSVVSDLNYEHIDSPDDNNVDSTKNYIKFNTTNIMTNFNNYYLARNHMKTNLIMRSKNSTYGHSIILFCNSFRLYEHSNRWSKYHIYKYYCKWKEKARKKNGKYF